MAELEPVCLAEQEFCVSFFTLDSQGGPNSDEHHAMSKPQEKSINEEVRKMMTKLFAVLEPEFVSFLATFEKIDSLLVFSYYNVYTNNDHLFTFY